MSETSTRIEQNLKWCRINSHKSKPSNIQFIVLGNETCWKYTLEKNPFFAVERDNLILLGVTTDKINKLVNILTY